MRGLNHTLPSQNKACVCITPSLYDRRALDSAISTLPLITSLNHLAFLTSTSPRIRDILTLDGGLERLATIVLRCLKAVHDSAQKQDGPVQLASQYQGGPFRPFASYSTKPQSDQGTSLNAAIALSSRAGISGANNYTRALLLTYTLALQSLVNVGVRGSESVRTRVVEAGVLTVAASVLRGYIQEREAFLARAAAELRKTASSHREAAVSPAPLRIRTSDMSLASSAPPSPTRAIPFASNSSVPPLSAQSSALPTRTNTPDTIQGLAAAQEESAGNSSEEGEMDQEREEELPEIADEQLMTAAMSVGASNSTDDMLESASEALAQRGRQRSATLKSRADEDEPMDSVADVDANANLPSTDMDVDMDDAPAPLSPAPSSTGTARPQASTLRRPRLIVEQPSPASVFTPSHMPKEHFRYRDEDVLPCLQLLAFLSKYPHIRAVFHDPSSDYQCSANLQAPHPPPIPKDKTNNLFSLVERFTVSPIDHRSILICLSGTEAQKKMLHDIHYWAGVIMRNACRKDEARGGIRQCANMACGTWEHFPREFAKCRRCRKAKYCSKNCQKKAWHGGHRFWCSSRESDRSQTRDTGGDSGLSASDHAMIVRFIEEHPQVASDPEALAELARRLRQLHQLAVQQRDRPANGERRRHRTRADTMPTMPAPPIAADALAPPPLRLRPTFNEDEDAEEERLPDDPTVDRALEIAGIGPERLMSRADVEAAERNR